MLEKIYIAPFRKLDKPLQLPQEFLVEEGMC